MIFLNLSYFLIILLFLDSFTWLMGHLYFENLFMQNFLVVDNKFVSKFKINIFIIIIFLILLESNTFLAFCDLNSNLSVTEQEGLMVWCVMIFSNKEKIGVAMLYQIFKFMKKIVLMNLNLKVVVYKSWVFIFWMVLYKISNMF